MEYRCYSRNIEVQSDAGFQRKSFCERETLEKYRCAVCLCVWEEAAFVCPLNFQRLEMKCAARDDGS